MTWTYTAELECGHELNGTTAEELYPEGPGAIVVCPEHGEVVVTRTRRRNW